MKKKLVFFIILVFLTNFKNVSFSQTISVSEAGISESYIKKFPFKTLVLLADTVDLIIKTGVQGNATSVTSVSFLDNTTYSPPFEIIGITSGAISQETGITAKLRFEPIVSYEYTMEAAKVIKVVLDNGIITFPVKAISVDYLYGDVTGDGRILAYDAAQVLKKVVLLVPSTALSQANMEAAMDVSNNTIITAYDASLILQYVVEKINEFPTGSNVVPKKVAPMVTNAMYGTVKEKDNQLVIPINIVASNIFSLEASYSFNPLFVDFKDIKFAENFAGMITQKNVLNDAVHFAIAGINATELTGDVIYLIFDLKEENKEETLINCEKLMLNEYLVELEETAFKLGSQIPRYYVLYQNFPNPFNMETGIKFGIPENNIVEIRIFNVLGQEVWSFEKDFKAGYHTLRWYGKNNQGMNVSSGVYIYRLKAGDFVQSKKMVIVK